MTIRTLTRSVVSTSIVLTLLVAAACTPMSNHAEDATAGMNGGFEFTDRGLPVNWLVYCPETIPEGTYDLSFDRTEFKEGEQSLKFAVHECSTTGGWHSPGLSQEYAAFPGASYRIRFWIRSDGCDFLVRVGGVDAWTGAYAVVASAAAGEGDDVWRRIEHVYTVPDRYERIRFELSIRSPGTLWIDGVTIDRIQEN